MIDIDLEAISNNAPKRFEEFEVAIKETSGITFPEKDREEALAWLGIYK